MLKSLSEEEESDLVDSDDNGRDFEMVGASDGGHLKSGDDKSSIDGNKADTLVSESNILK